MYLILTFTFYYFPKKLSGLWSCAYRDDFRILKYMWPPYRITILPHTHYRTIKCKYLSINKVDFYLRADKDRVLPYILFGLLCRYLRRNVARVCTVFRLYIYITNHRYRFFFRLPVSNEACNGDHPGSPGALLIDV